MVEVAFTASFCSFTAGSTFSSFLSVVVRSIVGVTAIRTMLSVEYKKFWDISVPFHMCQKFLAGNYIPIEQNFHFVVQLTISD